MIWGGVLLIFQIYDYFLGVKKNLYNLTIFCKWINKLKSLKKFFLVLSDKFVYLCRKSFPHDMKL